MTSADLLQHAIEKLEKLRAESKPGPWGRDVVTDPGLIYSDSRAGQTVAQSLERDDAALLLTLHRTIVAQLDILTHALARAQSKIATGGIDRAVWSHEKDALALARAITGEAEG